MGIALSSGKGFAALTFLVPLNKVWTFTNTEISGITTFFYMVEINAFKIMCRDSIIPFKFSQFCFDCKLGWADAFGNYPAYTHL